MPEPGRLGAVLLDLFDTVAHTPWSALRREVAAMLDVPLDRLLAGYDRTQASRNVGAFGTAFDDLDQVLRAAGLDPDAERVRQLVRFERDYLRRWSRFYDDVLPFLADVRRSGLAVGLVSNCSVNAQTVVDRLGLVELFDEVVVSYQVGVRKPDPGIYRIALQRLRTPAGAALYLDDQPRFCDGAAEVGMRAFVVARPVTDHPAPARTDRTVVRDLDWPAVAGLLSCGPSSAAAARDPRPWNDGCGR